MYMSTILLFFSKDLNSLNSQDFQSYIASYVTHKTQLNLETRTLEASIARMMKTLDSIDHHFQEKLTKIKTTLNENISIALPTTLIKDIQENAFPDFEQKFAECKRYPNQKNRIIKIIGSSDSVQENSSKINEDKFANHYNPFYGNHHETIVDSEKDLERPLWEFLENYGKKCGEEDIVRRDEEILLANTNLAGSNEKVERLMWDDPFISDNTSSLMNKDLKAQEQEVELWPALKRYAREEEKKKKF